MWRVQQDRCAKPDSQKYSPDRHRRLHIPCRSSTSCRHIGTRVRNQAARIILRRPAYLFACVAESFYRLSTPERTRHHFTGKQPLDSGLGHGSDNRKRVRYKAFGFDAGRQFGSHFRHRTNTQAGAYLYKQRRLRTMESTHDAARFSNESTSWRHRKNNLRHRLRFYHNENRCTEPAGRVAVHVLC